MRRSQFTPFFADVEERVMALGGYMNAHLHLDRAGTYHATVDLLSEKGVRDGTSLSLAGKHAVIPMVHASPLFDVDALYDRVRRFIEQMIEIGTSRADTVVDTTCDRVGASALDTLLQLKAAYATQIDFRVGAYSPLGFRDDQPQRWELMEETAGRADFIGLLPERDDRADYPDHIGFKESCRRGILLAAKHGKDIHIHVDQSNHAAESGGELVARLVRDLNLGRSENEVPFIWLIHLISPSVYDEIRFGRLAAELADLGIGVITCPSGAISMRQLRTETSPTFNSIARVLELLVAGVQVRIGSDNICDITSPMGTPDLMDELFVLANAVRYYDPDILAHLASGRSLGAELRARVGAHIADDRASVADAIIKIQKRAALALQDEVNK
jgi:cytosine deaminase